MTQRYFPWFALLAIVAGGLVTSEAFAQRGGRGGFGFGGGGRGGIDPVMLLGIEEVRQELDVTDEQQTSITALVRESRQQRRAGRDDQDRPNFREMTDEQRQEWFEERRKEREEQAKKDREKLNEILMPAQVARLDQIVVQVQGVNALRDDEVAKKLGMSDARHEEVVQVLNETGRDMQEKMREIFQSGDREGMREKMQELRKENETTVLAKLTDEEKKKYEELKGEPFELPEGALFRGGRGGGRDGEGGGRRGGDRPRRSDSI